MVGCWTEQSAVQHENIFTLLSEDRVVVSPRMIFIATPPPPAHPQKAKFWPHPFQQCLFSFFLTLWSTGQQIKLDRARAIKHWPASVSAAVCQSIALTVFPDRLNSKVLNVWDQGGNEALQMESNHTEGLEGSERPSQHWGHNQFEQLDRYSSLCY